MSELLPFSTENCVVERDDALADERHHLEQHGRVGAQPGCFEEGPHARCQVSGL